MASTIAYGINETIKSNIQKYLDIVTSDENTVVITPTIISTPINKNFAPFVSYNPLNPTSLLSGYYPNLNKDKTVQKTISKYFYYKIVDNWLYSTLRPLLGFIVIVNGKPQIIKSMAEFKNADTETYSDIEEKIKYMEYIILSKDMVKHVLKKIVKKYQINWYHLDKNEHIVKKTFYKYIYKKLESAISNHEKK
jgi:hypothetical protein